MLLRVNGLVKRFEGLIAVSGVDFELPDNMISVVIGPNGAGKTTFLNMIAGMSRPTAGTIFFRGRDVTGFSPARLVKAGIARNFQNIRLFESLTVKDHLLLGSQRTAYGFGFRLLGGGLGLSSKSKIADEIEMIMDILELHDVKDKLAVTLPYGAQRRVELARALASSPELLLLDEPTAGMLPAEAATMSSILRRIQKQKRNAMLIIEHNMEVVAVIADRVTVLHRGEKIAEGPATNVLSERQVVEVYLGRKRTPVAVS